MACLAPAAFHARTIDSQGLPLDSDQTLATAMSFLMQLSSGISGCGWGWYPKGYQGECLEKYPVWRMPAGSPKYAVDFIWNATHSLVQPDQSGTPEQVFAYQLRQGVPIPQGVPRVGSNDTDKECLIIDLETDEYWELWSFGPADNYSRSKGGTSPYYCQFGGHIEHGHTAFTGILANQMGAKACSVGMSVGMVTWWDVDQVMNHGGIINHTLCVDLPRTAYPQVLPATRCDSQNLTPADIPNNVGAPANLVGTANPAYTCTPVPEGSVFRFPSGSITPSGLTVLGGAIYDAIRDYGLIVVDSSENGFICFEDGVTVGTPYGLYQELPYKFNSGANEELYGTTNPVVQLQAQWPNLQVLAPFSVTPS